MSAIQNSGGGAGTPGGNNTDVQFNNAGAFGGDDAFTYSGNGAVTIGKAGVGTGLINFKGTTSGTVTLSVADAAGTWTMKLPNSGGTNGYVLQTDGSGNTSWVIQSGASGSLTVGTTTISGGTTKHALYDLAGVVQEAANFTIESGNPNVTATHGYMYDGAVILEADYGNANYFLLGSGNHTMSGTGNLALGGFAVNTSGSNNFAIGASVLVANTSGSSNIGIGPSAMNLNTQGSNNIGIGTTACRTTTGTNNTAIGYQAGFTLGVHTDNVLIGYLAGMALTSDTNVAIGSQALDVATTGIANVCVGYGAGHGITTGGGNILLCSGALAASFNQVTSGSNNVSLGKESAVATATASNQLVISNYIYGTGMDGTGATISAGKIGLGVKAPAVELDVAGSIKTAVNTVAGLPAPGNKGAKNFVSDATATTFASIVAGTGGNNVPVYDDGTNWRIG